MDKRGSAASVGIASSEPHTAISSLMYSDALPRLLLSRHFLTVFVVHVPLHFFQGLAVHLGHRTMQHIERGPMLRRLKHDVAAMRERQPSAAQRPKIIVPVLGKLVGA